MIASTWPMNYLVSISQSHKGKKYTCYKSLKLKYKTSLFCRCDVLHSNAVIAHCLSYLMGMKWQLLLILLPTLFCRLSMDKGWLHTGFIIYMCVCACIHIYIQLNVCMYKSL